MKTNGRALALIGATVALLLAACTSATPNTYATVDDLREAYVAAGGHCDDWAEGSTSGPWAQYGNCGSSGDTGEAVLSIYTSDSDLQTSVDGVKKRASTATLREMLVGKNWIIQASDVDAVQEKLGGTVVSVSSR